MINHHLVKLVESSSPLQVAIFGLLMPLFQLQQFIKVIQWKKDLLITAMAQ
jgi:hypothetical protein